MIDPERAQRFRALHRGDGVLLLPNAWDAMSAAIIAARGARAIATTSGGVAWSTGHPDGQHLDPTSAAEAIRRIVAVVDIPVSADIEAGYGSTPEAVAETVAAVIAVGVRRISLGTAMAQAAYALVERAANELLSHAPTPHSKPACRIAFSMR